MPSPSPRVRWTALAATLFSSSLLIASCSGSTSSSTQSSDRTPETGGDVVVGVSADPTCLDPQQNGNAASINASRQVVDSLTDLDPETGKTLPWLATSWSVNNDATRYTFTLREGVTFSDGTAFDADIVKRNLDKVVTLGAATSLVTSYLANYAGSTVLDAHTVQVDFSSPSAGFLQSTAVVQLGIVSASTLDKTAEERCRTGNIIGTGPFVFDSYTQNQSTVLSRRAGYAWPSGRSAHNSESYLDHITFQVIGESSVRTGSLQSGQLTAVTDVQPVDENPLSASGFTLLARTNPGVVNSLYPRPGNALTALPEVRQAIQIGIDRKALTALLSGSYPETTSVLASSTPGYADLSEQLAYDPDAAAALLDKAGWTRGADGIRTKDGTRLSLDVAYLNSVVTNKSVLQLVQQQLGDLGIDLVLRPLAVADYLQAVKEPSLAFSFGNFTRPELDVLRTSFSATTSSSRFADPNLEKLFTELQSTADPDARAEVGKKAQSLLVEQGYAIPVYELAQVAATSPKLHGLAFDSSSRLNFYDTWLEH